MSVCLCLYLAVTVVRAQCAVNLNKVVLNVSRHFVQGRAAVGGRDP